jgi:hypothetical protein
MARGFNKLKGVTIIKVDARCVNQIKLVGDDGYTYTIDAETGIGAIPRMILTSDKPKKKIGARLNKPKPYVKYPEDKSLD